MPAVSLAEINKTIALLEEYFELPDLFEHTLMDLYERYSDRVYRAGQTVQSRQLLPTFRNPPLVQRRLEIRLGPLCGEHPTAALVLADRLWLHQELEPRSLSAFFLGQLDIQYSSEVLQRLVIWWRPELPVQLQHELFLRGSKRLRDAYPAEWMAAVADWVALPKTQKFGLLALVATLSDESFTNLPPVYSLLSSLIQTPPPGLIHDISDVIVLLAVRSPQETLYYLRQTLALSSTPDAVRLIRRLLPRLEPAMQTAVRPLLQERGLAQD